MKTEIAKDPRWGHKKLSVDFEKKEPQENELNEFYLLWLEFKAKKDERRPR